jgi:hypothetical protein
MKRNIILLFVNLLMAPVFGQSLPTVFHAVNTSTTPYLYIARDNNPGANDSYLFHRITQNYHIIGSNRNGTGALRKIGFSFGGSDVESDIKMTLTEGGLVGIGTNNPTGKLDINHPGGQLRISGGTVAGGLWTDASDKMYLADWQTGSKGLFINLTSGNVGIGTTSPTAKLHVSGGEIVLDTDQPVRGGGKWLISGNSTAVTTGTASPGVNLRLMAGANDPRIQIDGTSGNVGIGTLTPDSKLSVKGQIHAQEVQVDLNGAVAPDYVFDKDYKLPTLQEIQSYITANKHLPEVPSAKEMEEKGIVLGEMNLLLLKKVEELTLYILEQEKRIQKLEQKDNQK